MNDLTEYKNRCKQQKIENYKLDISKFENVLPIQYSEWKNYTFTQRYKRKYHFGELFNRIFCQEKNKPNQTEIENIRSKLFDNYSMTSIYKVSTYNQRKHLVYIWHILNNNELPTITSKMITQKDTLLRFLNAFYTIIGTNKSIKYRLVIDVICEHFNFNEIRKLLYFKHNKIYKDKVVQTLNLSINNNVIN